MSESQLAHDVSESMVSRLAKVLNQAERAPEGSPERATYMDAALRLSAAYSIDLAVARAHQAKKEQVEQPEKRGFKVGNPDLTQNKNAHFVDLMLAICQHNDIEVTISGSNLFVYGHGMPSDLDVAERLFALLSVQMVAEADAGLKAQANYEMRTVPRQIRVEIPEDERAWGQHDGTEGGWGDNYANTYDDQDEEISSAGRRYWKGGTKAYPPPKFKLVDVTDADGQVIMEEKLVSTSDARVWRVNFYQSFISEIGRRLYDIRREALKNAGIDLSEMENPGAIAIRDKAKEVNDFFQEEARFVLSTGRTYGGAEVSKYSHGGSRHGSDAGSRAKLGNEKDVGRKTKEIG